jgi:hypothetical protein
MKTDQYGIAISTFERIRVAFPALAMNLDLHHKHVDLAMDIPAQPGLSFHIHLNLQNVDELHLSASALWVEWFPCTNPKRVEEYFEAVSGLLSGQFRILEHWRGRRAVKAKLQRPATADGRLSLLGPCCYRSRGRQRASRSCKTSLPLEPMHELNEPRA